MAAKYQRGEIVKAGETGVVKFLQQCISGGADVDEQDENGCTALIKAAMNGRKDAVQFLLDHDADVNHQDKDGDHALYQAARYGYKDICEVLLKAGADTSLKNQGTTAAQRASARSHPEVAELIRSWKGKDDSTDADRAIAEAMDESKSGKAKSRTGGAGGASGEYHTSYDHTEVDKDGTSRHVHYSAKGKKT